ncbi:MAG: hypothetical protein IRY94_18480, partial [Rhodospirillaceae bacterium]|nr:hypothetical protein [Rhodospirillaceae bacterium]
AKEQAAKEQAAKEKAAKEAAERKKQAEKKDFASVLKDLTKSAPPAATAPSPAEQPQVAEATSAVGGPRMTASEVDGIKKQIEDNWVIPPSVIGAQNTDMTVVVKVQLDAAGNVVDVFVPDRARLSDPTYEAVARSIATAAMKASPLRDLPPDKFDVWKTMTLTFNLREYVGQ